MEYVKKHFPAVEFVKQENMGHAEMAALQPDKMAAAMKELLETGSDAV